MANILFEKFSGISDSLWNGIEGSFYKMVGVNIHGNPGSLTVNQRLDKDSGATVDALSRVRVSASNGYQFWFSYTSGKIWARSSAGAWTLAYTTVPAAGAAGCLGAFEYNGFIFWATQSRLHRIAIANADDAWASVDLDWQTFTSTDSEFHPMTVVNGVLYIGDKNMVASVNAASTFTANDLDLEEPQRIKTMVPKDIDLLIGTIVAQTVNECKLIRWDTVQTSWQYEETVLENGINAFFWLGTQLVVQAGTMGNLYLYDGQTLQPYKRIPGTWTPTKFGEVYPQAVGVFQNLAIFGLSNSPAAANSTGNPADQGIYTLGHYSKDYPVVLSGPEFIISQDKVATIEIGAVLVEGTDLYVSWKDGANFGVDKLNWSAKYASAYIESRVMTADPENLIEFLRVFASYSSLPASTSLTFKYKANHAAAYVSYSTVDETGYKQLYAEESIKARAYQFRVEFTVSSNNAPEIEHLGLVLQD